MSVPFDTLAPLADHTLADLLFPENGSETDVILAIHANWLADTQGLNTAQNDTPQRDTTVVGTTGSDTFVTTAGEDLLYGQTGNDTFLFENGAGVTTGDQLYGGGDTDRILLSGAGTYNFTADFQVSSIEEIEFGADGINVSKTMVLGSGELNGSTELANVLIDGNLDSGSDDNIVANVTLIANIDLSGWTFFDWDSSIDTITINGSSAGNALTGTSENDTINGLGGNDTLYGGNGTDVLNGGAGDDFLVYDLFSGLDHYDGGANTDILDFSGNTVDMTFNYDTQTYGSTLGGSTFDFIAIESFIGSAAAYTFIGANLYEYSLDGGAGSDTLDLSSDTDLFTTAGDYFLDVDQGFSDNGGLTYSGDWLSFENLVGFANASMSMYGNDADNTLTGSSQNDVIYGEIGNDVLYGGDGNDSVYGGTGSDTVNDGTGNDVIDLGGGDDHLILGDSDISGDSYDGGVGTDTFDATGFTWSVDTRIDLTAGTWGSAMLSEDIVNFENIEGANNNTGIIETLIGTSDVNIINGNGGDDDIDGLGGNDVLNGGGGSDFINAGGGNDTVIGGTGKDDLIGGGGNDVLFGGDDNDTVRGGVGADSMSGGTGSDTLSYTSDTIGVNVNLSSNIVSGGNAEGDTIASFESVKAGSGDNMLIGTISANAIISRGGNDSLYGLDGDDRIAGGGGDDLLRGDGGADLLNGGGGTDTLSYSTDTIGVNVDIGLNTASGGHATGDTISRFENLTGGTGDDILRGSGGDNVINGGSGNDRLSGRTGDDTLIGGAGTDTLNGGEGMDVLTGGTGADVFIFSGTTNDDTITDFEVGIDTLKIYGQVEADVTFGDAGGGGTLITLASGDTILVENTSIADLNTFDDFQFV